MAQFFQIHPVNPQPRLIRLAAAILRAGGVIAYPTDSGYALGCHIGDAAAAKRIRELRGVGAAHHLTLVLRDLSEIGHFARLDNWQFRIVRQGTPGRYTFLLPATREVPRRLQHPKRSTVGVRVPDHAVVQRCSRSCASRSCRRRSSCRAQAAERCRSDSRCVGARSTSSSMPAPAAAPTTVVDLARIPPAIRGRSSDQSALGLGKLPAKVLG
jgi:tRNA threonylcarbamoyl adenosine modification protein (Sua5/YciO/YrdC/YwlC family)